jgi:hypothetical protein
MSGELGFSVFLESLVVCAVAGANIGFLVKNSSKKSPPDRRAAAVRRALDFVAAPETENAALAIFGSARCLSFHQTEGQSAGSEA